MAFGVLIVDDNPLFLEAARDLLEREGQHVVGVAATSTEALQRAEELRPEVVLVDIMLGSESGSALRIASGQDCPIGPGQPRGSDLALEHGDLMAQDEELGVLGTVEPGEQGEPAEYAQHGQVRES